ncbi:MAG: hypothetical protein JSS83_22560 [Cyanobacteria bacterium SZAS LIN-3]|nr:hypothetical protein [Cyanobacteria bacterium SZAS LIN-3]
MKADERSDIYSLGCTFFEALTGFPPFCGENSFQTFMMHQTKLPPTLAKIAPDGNFTDALELVVATMLKKDPAARYQTMLQVQHDLERIKSNKPVREQGLVSIASNTTETIGKQFDIESDTARLVKIAAGFAAAIFSVWALFAFIIKPQVTRARVEAELSKNKAAADSMASLDKIARTPASAFAKSKDPAAIVAERNRYNQDPRGVYTSYVTPEDFMDHGISASEFDQTTNFSYRLLGEEKKVFNEHLRHHLAQCKKDHTMFRRTKPQPGFQFFDNISIGAIQINNKKPVFATNFVPVPKNSDVCLYLETATSDSAILDFFGPDEINGVEFVWPAYKPLLQHCLKWNHLKKLCTFNSLIKAPLLAEQLDETAIDDNDLLTIDQYPGLTTLGLSGRKITPEAILKMRALSNVEALRFKTVANIDKVLTGLAPLNNLRELWLLNEGLTDEQLKPLINIKNLQTLRIMRNPLTPDSYKIFAQLPNLKTLNLSTSWDNDEQEKFKANLPKLHVTFEPSTDLSYWVLVTKGPKTTPHFDKFNTR